MGGLDKLIDGHRINGKSHSQLPSVPGKMWLFRIEPAVKMCRKIVCHVLLSTIDRDTLPGSIALFVSRNDKYHVERTYQ